MKETKNKTFLRQLKENIEQEKNIEKDNEFITTLIKENAFEQGLNLTKEIMSGSKVKTPRLLVETSQCKIWEKHNRAFELLNDIRCKDLIDQFKETGKQEFPGIVRLIENGGEVKYEIICGARRFWTSKYLGWKYFVEIRELTDEEAFRLSDVENRAREDISDYERALDYKHALGYYYQNQVQMASRLEVSTSWLSRYLDIADFPEEVVSAYRDITEIKVIHARKLKPFLSNSSENKSNRDKVIHRAIELKGMNYDGTKVVAELLSVIKTKIKRNRPKTHYSSKNGFVNMQIRIRKDKKIELLIDKLEKASKEDVLELLNSSLDNYF
jgi:ParB family chromosome partitioning protein